MVCKMEFREVTDLVPGTRITRLVRGTKYRIVYCNNVYNLKFTGFYSHICEDNCFYVFRSLTHGSEFIRFRDECYHFYLPNFQKERIQSNMEHRAVNLIIQRIIGDPFFCWAEPIVPNLCNSYRNNTGPWIHDIVELPPITNVTNPSSNVPESSRKWNVCNLSWKISLATQAFSGRRNLPYWL